MIEVHPFQAASRFACLSALVVLGACGDDSGAPAEGSTGASTGGSTLPETTGLTTQGVDDTTSNAGTTQGSGSDSGPGTSADGTGSSGGNEAICGNGIVEPGEACDEARAPCLADCTWEPGTLVWGSTIPGSVPTSLAVADDQLWVVGSQLDGTADDSVSYPEARTYALSGEALETFSFHGRSEPGQGNDIVPGPDGELYVAGQTGWPLPPLNTAVDARLWRLSGDGSVDWVQMVGPMGATNSQISVGRGVALLGDRVTVAASAFAEVAFSDWLVQQRDLSGALQWDALNPDLVAAAAVLALADGSIIAVGNEGADTTIRVYSPQGLEVSVDTLPLGGGNALAQGDGVVFVAGGTGASWVAAISEAGAVQWSKPVQAEGVTSLAVDLDGNLDMIGKPVGDLPGLVIVEVDPDPLTKREAVRGSETPLWSRVIEADDVNAFPGEVWITQDDRLFACGMLRNAVPTGWVGELGG